MPIGHALMVLTEILLGEQKLLGALIIGLIGVIALIYGVKKNFNKSTATILGLLGGILIWTGWIEFSFVWIAEKWNIPALTENGEVVTKPEYLIMPSSIGLLSTFFLLFLFSNTKCQFFNWFQKLFGLKKQIKSIKIHKKPTSIITFIETIMILWTFYIVLLLVYDKDIAGDNHPLTYLVAFGSLFWSIYLFQKLIKIKKFDYAIRYAIPTVIIFWNFVEVLGRWNLFKEIWIHPFEHWIEILIITLLFIAFITYYIIENRNTKINLKPNTK
jgi:hypothetical protein